MLFKVTKRDYEKLNQKYSETLKRNAELEITKEAQIRYIDELKRKIEVYEYQAKLNEEDISKMKRILSNSLEERNRLNVELLKLKKRKSRKKVEEVK